MKANIRYASRDGKYSYSGDQYSDIEGQVVELPDKNCARGA
jgi:hypothetical protein